MSFIDSLKKTVKKTVEDASKTLSTVADDASKKISTVTDDVSKKVSLIANDASKTVSSAKDSAYDRIRVMTITKIRSMIRGLNLQSVIDSLNKVSKEKKIDVSNLVAFIEDLKKYGENGK